MVPGAVPGRAPGRTLKFLFIFALIALLAALVFSLAPLGGWREPVPAVLHGRAVTMIRGEGPLRAGGAQVRIELGDEPVLGGYAGHHRAAGPGEPVFARALALEAGNARVLIASIDTLLISGDFEEEVLRRANLKPETCLMLTATHTHSGPGGVWDNLLAGWAGAGKFDAAQRDAIAQAAARALVSAVRALQPAQAVIARADWPDGPARPRSEGPIDADLAAVALRSPRGERISALVIYGMHPTMAARDRISADWPGNVSTDPLFGPALVLQGAGGNATWARDVPAPGSAVAQKALDLLLSARPLERLQLSCETRILSLPRPQAGRRLSWPLRRAAGNALALGLSRFALQTRVSLGPLQLIGVPGEPVGEVGLHNRPAVLVGLADGYVGYVETPERWQAGAGESAKSYFGPGLARALGLWSAPP